MTLPRLAATAVALWLGAEIVGGVSLAADLNPLERVGTLLVTALLFIIVDAMATGVRRAVLMLCEPIPIAVAVALALGGALVWVTAALASAAGLGYTINGYVPAVLVWMMMLAARVLAPARPGRR